MQISTYTALILLSSLIIFSYLFDLLAKRTKVPSVLLLLATGVGLQYLTMYLDVKLVNFAKILPALGTIGLVLIVLEGALDLRFQKEKLRMIRSSFASALFILLLTVGAITYLFLQFTGKPLHTCLLNAIPFGIISSAIAIPSVANLHVDKREFVIYESSFSDILGIIFFNFVLTNVTITGDSFVLLAVEAFGSPIIAIIISLAVLWLLKRLKHHVKFFLIIALLLLIYAVAKQFHLSALIIVLIFGLVLNNAPLFLSKKYRNYFVYDGLREDLHQFHLLTAESAFILRTFFFMIFGFTIYMEGLFNLEVFGYGFLILLIIYGIRALYLKFIAKTALVPELYITPRGLISILLFLNIPEANWVIPNADNLLLLVILATSILMAVGLLRVKPIEEAEQREIKEDLSA